MNDSYALSDKRVKYLELLVTEVTSAFKRYNIEKSEKGERLETTDMLWL
jgi:hypothetical protein